jgi:hypothetical protein
METLKIMETWVSVRSLGNRDIAEWPLFLFIGAPPTSVEHFCLYSHVAVLGPMFRVRTTVRTLPVGYVIEREPVLGVDRRIGQGWIDRLESRK